MIGLRGTVERTNAFSYLQVDLLIWSLGMKELGAVQLG
jgi:hypothetical protein